MVKNDTIIIKKDRKSMKKNHFQGYYFKHSTEDLSISFIVGEAGGLSFIQAVTNDKSYNFNFKEIQIGEKILIGENIFSTKGIKIRLPNINGDIEYGSLTPINYNILGPFALIPMECKHFIISMSHNLKGKMNIERKEIDFSKGRGYIEGDYGKSFPKRYVWLHSNMFKKDISVMAAIATVPIFKSKIMGCIAIVNYNSKEYRFATYLGAEIAEYGNKKIILRQGKYTLEIEIIANEGHKLYSPKNGSMTDIIRESNSSKGNFRLVHGKSIIFDEKSENISFEYNF